MGLFDFFKKNKNAIKEEKVKVINEELKKVITSLCKNEIVINIDEFKKVESKKSSKIGGKPYLPRDFIWPTYKSYDDNITRPLSFICQINLSELNEFDKDLILPKKGMLYLFYECESMTWGFDPNDKGSTRVFYYEEIDGFAELDLPKEIESHNIFPEIYIEFESRKSYPMTDEFEFYSDLEYDFDDYDNILEDLGVDLDDENSKLLGYANILQGEMSTECERVSRGLYCGDSLSYENTEDEVKHEINDEASNWILLFQIGTINKRNFEWMFGDCGFLYVYIKKSDLLEKNFSNIQFSVQCY